MTSLCISDSIFLWVSILGFSLTHTFWDHHCFWVCLSASFPCFLEFLTVCMCLSLSLWGLSFSFFAHRPKLWSHNIPKHFIQTVLREGGKSTFSRSHSPPEARLAESSQLLAPSHWNPVALASYDSLMPDQALSSIQNLGMTSEGFWESDHSR